MAKHDAVAEPKESALERELSERIAFLEGKWKIVENFLSSFGTYYNSEGRPARFIIDRFVNDGANGVALTPNQGLVEHFALPMHIDDRTDKQKKEGVKIIGPCWVPEIIPEAAKEAVEEFGADGDTSKAIG